MSAAATNGDVKKEIKDESTSPGKAQKIVSQVEYYFGDINLPRDKFLQEEMKKDHGWIPLITMLKFNRLAALSNDVEVIGAALRDSHLIDLSDDGQKIRRNPELPLPENTLEYWQEIKRRTVYVKGFPQETGLDQIAEFLGQFGNLQNTVMRKTKGSKETPKIFKGSVFATYASLDEAKKMAEQKELKYGDEHALINLMQDQYWAKKHNERQKEKELKKQMKKTQVEQQNKAHFKKGMVLKLVGFPEPTAAEPAEANANEEGEGKEKTQRGKKQKSLHEDQINEVKAFFEPFAKAAFVQIRGNEALVRFYGEDDAAATEALEKAQQVSKAADGKIVINGVELAGTVLEGEEEANYFAEFNKAKVNKAQREHDMKQKGKGKKDKAKERQNRKRRADRGEGHESAGQPKGKRTVFNDEDEDGGEKMVDEDEENGTNEGKGQTGGGKVADETDDEPVGAKKPKVEA